jgi:hypothetical protein
MSITPSVYAKARSEVASMLGYDLDNLSAEQATRVDIATALRVLLDNQTGKLLRGESLDARELLMASDALSKILPQLREPAAAPREDPRQVMWQIYSEMRSRGEINLRKDGEIPGEGLQAKITQLESENAQLRAALGGSITLLHGVKSSAITPREADITPPSELGQCHVGVKPGPDDPKPPATIEAHAVRPNPPAAGAAPPSRPQNFDDTPGGKAWQAWHDAGGSVGGDRWSNRNIP